MTFPPVPPSGGFPGPPNDPGLNSTSTGGGVTSFNTRTGAVILTKGDVTGTGLAAADVGADASGAATAAAATRVIVDKFPFAFNTPGLIAGVNVYVPAIGDVLLDAWIEVTTVWNSVTLADIGTFNGSVSGLFAAGLGAVSLVTASDAAGAGAGYVFANAGTSLSLAEMSASLSQRVAPGRFTAVNPLKLCVSTTGQTSGSPPTATQGAAILYLVTATPQ